MRQAFRLMKLLRRLALAAVVLAAAAAVAAWTCPADLAYRYLGDRIEPVVLHGLSGTVWQGRAEAVDLFRQNIGALEWRLQPAALLRGEAIAQLSLSGDGLAATGTVSRAADGQISFRDAVVRMPARTAAPVLATPALDLLGTIEIDVTRARVRGAWLDEATGVAYWRDAAVIGAAQARLGDLRVTFASATDGRIAGAIRDLGGPLQAQGTFSASLGRYAARVQLAARDNDAHVAEALQYVGQPQPDGSRLLEVEGRQLGVF